MKPLVGCLVVIMFFGCKSGAEVHTIYPNNIVIDGRLGDWKNHFPIVDKISNAVYSFAYDDTCLYFFLNSTDQITQLLIMLNGIRFTITDSNFKSSPQHIYHFPKFSEILLVNKEKESKVDFYELPELKAKLATNINKSSCGFNTNDSSWVDKCLEGHINVIHPNLFVYELKIPMKIECNEIEIKIEMLAFPIQSTLSKKNRNVNGILLKRNLILRPSPTKSP